MAGEPREGPVLKLPARVPRATYRVQLHSKFAFGHLAELIPYLDDLGISDLYLAPIFCANPGSTHGYDVCDHNRINDELGGIEGLRQLSGLLRERGMGLVADFVPNHMGVEGSLNWRWMDVLENGPTSRFAPFFDIEWNPRQPALQDRILVPLLHDFYGRVLESGEIEIRYADQVFWACYRTLRFPLRFESYADILHRLAQHGTRGNPLSGRLEKMAQKFRALPVLSARESFDDASLFDRERTRLRKELAEIVAAENLGGDLARTLEYYKGQAGRPDSFDPLHQLLEEQHYRLAFWKTGTHETNYRRFFAVDSLVGLHMEVPEVFAATHELLQALVAEGIVTGVRLDHIDGLWDPAQYLERLHEITGGPEVPTYTLVEKIVTANEQLDRRWAVHGTTGYEFAGSVIDLLLAPDTRAELTHIYGEFTGHTLAPDEQAYRVKLEVMELLFPNAVDNLVMELESQLKSDRRWRDWTVSDLRPALAGILASLSVYRTYRTTGEPMRADDVRVVENAVAEALRFSRSSNPQPYHFIRDLWIGRYPDEAAGPELRTWADAWVSKLQQVTGAIMAKSIEDTLFYRYVRLFAANEVGHHPAEFGRSVADFHATNAARQEQWPACLLTTSTHDTKMSEDVRARLLALSAMPAAWEAALRRWSGLNRAAKTTVQGELAPDANEEYLLYQVLLGAWPLEAAGVDDTFRRRIKDYMQKAHTSWPNPNAAWLKASDDFVDGLLLPERGAAFLEDFQPFADEVAYRGMLLSLVQVALKLTSPGVPDIYQGTELWEFSLVDPDNRRPVDYSIGQKHWRDPATATVPDLLASWKNGKIKMHVIRALLRHRRENPALFSHGAYVPIEIAGPQAERFVAFLREHEGARLLLVAVRQIGDDKSADWRGLCAGHTLALPRGPGLWRHLLTGEKAALDRAEIPLESLFDLLPVSIWVANDSKSATAA